MSQVTLENPDVVQTEVVDEPMDTPYLTTEMISGGKLRNIITVKCNTKGGSFLVDVVKQNPLYRILNSKDAHRLLKRDEDNEDIVQVAQMNMQQSYETLAENIARPQLTVKNDKLYAGSNEVPGDTIDLILQAYDLVNAPANTNQAVRSFQETDEQ